MIHDLKDTMKNTLVNLSLIKLHMTRIRKSLLQLQRGDEIAMKLQEVSFQKCTETVLTGSRTLGAFDQADN